MARGVSSWVFFALLAGGGTGFAACADAPAAVDPAARAQPTSPIDGDAGRADADAGPKPPRATDGPGAHVTENGVLFRVWAPNATGASVVGDVPGGEATMKAEGAGFFAADLAGIRPGARYHFALETGAGKLQRIDPYCRERGEDAVTCHVVDPLAYVWKTPRFERPKREKQIVYEMHVGSFTVDGARGYGTFASAKPKLAELADLGVNVVELMPVTAFGGGDAGWGYNPQLHFAPKPSYGTADELRAFIDEAHRLGIAVWLDAVVNHHDSWSQAPLRCFDGACPNGSAGLYYFGAGPYAMTPWGPRPNFADANVAKMLVDSAIVWIDELHGDGFRWDSTSNIRAIDGSGTMPGGKELLVALNAACHDRGATSVAEDLKGYADLTKPAAQGGFGFDAQWDGFGYDVSRVLADGNDDARDLGVIERAVTGGENPFARLLFTETHDTVGNDGARLPSKVDAADPESFAARRRSMLGAALLFTSPGTPMLFMGQEHLATGTFASTPQPLAAPTPVGTRIRAFYKDLAALRTNTAGAAGALSEPGVQILHRNDAAKVLAYQRTSAGGGGGQDVIVFVNLRNRAYTRYDIGVPAGGTYRVRVTSDRQTYGTDFPEAPATTVTALAQPYDGKAFTLPVALGAYGVVVLTR
jgi:1,4-alpha-glucan branching enzyme